MRTAQGLLVGCATTSTTCEGAVLVTTSVDSCSERQTETRADCANQGMACLPDYGCAIPCTTDRECPTGDYCDGTACQEDLPDGDICNFDSGPPCAPGLVRQPVGHAWVPFALQGRGVDGSWSHTASMLRTFLITFASVVVLCGAQGACSTTNGNCSIFASDYDQSCRQDTDCVAVFSGSFCGGHSCACENSAINVSDQQRYVSDLQSDDAPECPCPAPPAVACSQGTCVVRPLGLPDGGTD